MPQGPRLAETPITYPLPRGSDPFAVPGVTGAGVCSYLQNFGQRTKGVVVVLEGPGLTPTTPWLYTEWGPEQLAAGRGCSRGVLVLCLLPGRGFPRELVVEEVPLWEVGPAQWPLSLWSRREVSDVAPVRLGLTVQGGAQGTRPSLGRGCRPIKEEGNPTWSCHVAL